MKRTILSIALFAAVAVAACNSGTTESKSTGNAAAGASAAATPKDPEVEKGLNLVAQSDCFQCHRIDEDNTGPAYVAVSKRYAGAPADTIKMVAAKIISGGSGRWTTNIMTAHPDLSPADAETMMKYILSLK